MLAGSTGKAAARKVEGGKGVAWVMAGHKIGGREGRGMGKEGRQRQVPNEGTGTGTRHCRAHACHCGGWGNVGWDKATGPRAINTTQGSNKIRRVWAELAYRGEGLGQQARQVGRQGGPAVCVHKGRHTTHSNQHNTQTVQVAGRTIIPQAHRQAGTRPGRQSTQAAR